MTFESGLKGKLTGDFLRAHCVVFYPDTAEDAMAIQQELFGHGIHWSTGLPEVKHVQRILEEGMTAADGQIFCGVVENEAHVVAQLGDFAAAAPRPKGRAR